MTTKFLDNINSAEMTLNFIVMEFPMKNSVLTDNFPWNYPPPRTTSKTQIIINIVVSGRHLISDMYHRCFFPS